MLIQSYYSIKRNMLDQISYRTRLIEYVAISRVVYDEKKLVVRMYYSGTNYNLMLRLASDAIAARVQGHQMVAAFRGRGVDAHTGQVPSFRDKGSRSRVVSLVLLVLKVAIVLLGAIPTFIHAL